MNNYCWFYKGLLLLLFTGRSACSTADQPKTIDAVAVSDYSKRILNHPLYDSTDKFSFTTAVVRYKANAFGQNKFACFRAPVFLH